MELAIKFLKKKNYLPLIIKLKFLLYLNRTRNKCQNICTYYYKKVYKTRLSVDERVLNWFPTYCFIELWFTIKKRKHFIRKRWRRKGKFRSKCAFIIYDNKIIK